MKLTLTLSFIFIGLFNLYSQVAPASAEVHFNIGNAKHKDGQYQEAIAEYTQAIEMDTNFTRAYFNRGSSRSSVEDYEGAIADFGKAIETDPTYVKAYYHRAFLKNKLTLYAEAIEDYNKVIELSPDYIIAYYNRGLAYYYNKEMDLACTDWRKSMELGYSKAKERIDKYCK